MINVSIHKKKIACILLFLCFHILPCDGQVSSLLREVFETAAHTAPKTIIKTEARVLPKALIETTVIHEAITPILSSFERSPLISSAFKENARNFYQRLRKEVSETAKMVEERLADEAREEIIEEIAEELDDDGYLDDILENPMYPKLKQSICKMYNRDSLTEKDIQLILNGGAIDSTCIDEETLYAIYFKLSDPFAEKELANIASAGNCDESILKDVKKIANERNVKFSAAACLTENDDDTISDMVVYVLLIIIIYMFIRKMLRKFSRSPSEASVNAS
jgi:hypothetical protein